MKAIDFIKKAQENIKHIKNMLYISRRLPQKAGHMAPDFIPSDLNYTDINDAIRGVKSGRVEKMLFKSGQAPIGTIIRIHGISVTPIDFIKDKDNKWKEIEGGYNK